MSTTRRSLLTAAAAGALLGALSFVPSANATVTSERPGPRPVHVHAVPVSVAAPGGHTAATAGSPESSGMRTMSGPADTTSPGPATDSGTETDSGTGTGTGTTAGDTELADTGAFDTTPYILGGTAFLGMGAAFLVYSVRRERMGL
ncbi:cell wall protein [Streptomyces abyssomicinicus]|uniref:cell wall protein n=1 Tax=Streptomyces abyssomicinicus TaxID=574929 RepID=UPI0015843F5A|nr:cell wall protein [Streptomyces abyssomicinicus]